MTTLVRADHKRRLCIRGAKPGQEYIVKSENGGWRVTPNREVRAGRNRREWAGSKRSVLDHLKDLADSGLRVEKAEIARKPVPPCRF